MGWRYQIPMFVEMGLRVVAPDCLGYGRTVRVSSSKDQAVTHFADTNTK